MLLMLNYTTTYLEEAIKKYVKQSSLLVESDSDNKINNYHDDNNFDCYKDIESSSITGPLLTADPNNNINNNNNENKNNNRDSDNNCDNNKLINLTTVTTLEAAKQLASLQWDNKHTTIR